MACPCTMPPVPQRHSLMARPSWARGLVCPALRGLKVKLCPGHPSPSEGVRMGSPPGPPVPECLAGRPSPGRSLSLIDRKSL